MNEITSIFERIEQMDAQPPWNGWCTVRKAQILASLVLATRPSCVVEIGVFAGRSAIPMALAIKANGYGKLYAIDPWARAESIKELDGENQRWWGQLDHEEIYREFVGRVQEAQTTEIIQIVRASSDATNPPVDIDILHVDGSHESAACRDMQRFGANVRAGGYLIADDLDWASGQPARGAEWLLAHGFEERYRLGSGAVFQRAR